MAHIVKDWRTELMQAHPRLFLVMAGKPEYLFGSPLCEVGWRDIIERMCGRIENALQDDETFEFVRIRQKFGILRVNWDAEVSDDTATKIGHAVDLAVARSACTCEICGSVGRLYSSRGWLSTRCTEHTTGDPVPLKTGWENIRRLRRRRGETELYYARYDREADTLTEISPGSPGPEE